MNDPQHELRRFVERASRRIQRLFDRQGHILPMYLIMLMDGSKLAAPPPVRDKDTSLAMMRAFFASRPTRRYLFVDEVWMIESSNEALIKQASDHLAAHGSLRDHPARIEKVALLAEDCDLGFLMGLRSIERPAGRKPHLGPLVIDEGISGWQGRMVGLLPRTGTVQ